MCYKLPWEPNTLNWPPANSTADASRILLKAPLSHLLPPVPEALGTCPKPAGVRGAASDSQRRRVHPRGQTCPQWTEDPQGVGHVQGCRLEKLAGNLEPAFLGGHPSSLPLLLSTYRALQLPSKCWTFCSQGEHSAAPGTLATYSLWEAGMSARCLSLSLPLCTPGWRKDQPPRVPVGTKWVLHGKCFWRPGPVERSDGGAAVMLRCHFPTREMREPLPHLSLNYWLNLTELFSHLRGESHLGFPVPREWQQESLGAGSIAQTTEICVIGTAGLIYSSKK